MIVDECLTFFLAGTQTTSSLVGQTIAQAIKDPKIMSGIKQELHSLCESHNAKSLGEFLNLDSLSELNYLQMCINEGLRFEPPLSRSTSMMMSEDVNCGNVHIKAGDIFVVDMYGLHRNPDQWIKANEYLPERFDPKSPLSLAPNG